MGIPECVIEGWMRPPGLPDSPPIGDARAISSRIGAKHHAIIAADSASTALAR
jgi:hypothetical protein